jgi:hypothetical protein
MKKSALKFLKLMMMALIVSATIISCDDDDSDGPELTGDSKTYTLSSVSDPSISGTVKFSERSDNATLVTIDLNGTTAGNSHPAHFHSNSAVETGDIIIELNPVDGATGISETVVKRKKDGSKVTYEDLLELDAYVNVHLSAADLNTLVAQGDVGVNELTNTFATYDLAAVNASGITGTVKFAKRVSGSTLVTVDLDGAGAAGEYPVYIYDNNIANGGPIAIDLTTVNGATGVSYTHVAELNSGTAITYDELANFNGHVLVSASPATPTVYVAQANIGSND